MAGLQELKAYQAYPGYPELLPLVPRHERKCQEHARGKGPAYDWRSWGESPGNNNG
jgi:hypothetical protein